MIVKSFSLFAKGIREALSNEKIIALFLVLFVFSLIIFSFVLNAISLPYLISNKEILVNFAITIDGILFICAFSFLVSLFISLAFYKYSIIKESSKNADDLKVGTVGILIASFTSACSICPPLLLTYLGFPAALSLLPFGGWEIRTLSLVFLSVSVYFAALEIANSKNCKI